MDLLQSVRKEGSRGGVDFKWDDVKSSQHRENYLGHSLMAPVGRWQKGKDLNWYAKGDSAEKTVEEQEAEERELRKAELRKIKEAEEDAMARALGLPVPDRSANTEPLGESKIDQKEVKAALREALDDNEEESSTKPRIEHSSNFSHRHRRRDSRERRHREYSRDRPSHHRHRSRSHDRDRHHRRHRDRSRSRDERRRSRSRSRENRRRRSRSRSPARRARHDHRDKDRRYDR